MRIEGLSDLTPEGSGGFSQVFRAIETRYDRAVAAKVLNFRLEAKGDRDRFESECRAMGQLSDHPNIVPLYSTSYTDEGYPVIIMEFFTGGTLADRVRRGIGAGEVLDIGVKIASALHCAHDRGVIHRDVKPQNVLLSRFSEPGLTDFGISAIVKAKGLSKSTGITLAYAAPEALDGETSASTDVYSLAATLYTALAEQRPFDAPGRKQPTSELIRKILHEEPPPLQTFGFSAAVDNTVRRTGMAKDSARRPRSAQEFGEMLRDLQRNEGYAATAWTEARDVTNRSAPTYEGPADESITLIRRHETDESIPEPEPEPKPAWTPRRIAALIGGAVALAALTFTLLLSRDSGGDEVVDPLPSAVSALDPTFQQSVFEPTDVVIERTEQGRAVVRWNGRDQGDDVTFQIRRTDPSGVDEAPMLTAETQYEIGNIGDREVPCVVLRSVRESTGQISLDSEQVCLFPELGVTDPVISMLPESCEPGACEFRIDGLDFIPGSTVSVQVIDPSGVDINSVFGAIYDEQAAILPNGVIDWRWSPGTSAPTGTYQVTVIDDLSGTESISFFDLVDPDQG